MSYAEPLPEPPAGPLDEHEGLREELFQHLRDQGFRLTDAGLISPVDDDKSSLRRLHAEAVNTQRERARATLSRYDKQFTQRLALGREVDPSRIRPRIVILPPGQTDISRLWRWCSLHWAIPVSAGYGRRIRALIVDEGHNDAVIGLIGLSDPVFALRVRDNSVGWSLEQRTSSLANVMDAFVLGAVPPYTHLLGGKLTASLLQANTIRDAFRARYGHKTTLISGRDPDAELALITTSSALGRSSVYNRVRREDGSLAMRSIGFTKGSGDFHLSGAIYDRLATLASAHTEVGVTQRHENWGTGFRNRREVIQRALRILRLSPSRMRVHGVRREVFLSEMADNSLAWLRGEETHLRWRTLDETDISSWWRTRWAEPRAQTTSEWRDFNPETWALYPPGDC